MAQLTNIDFAYTLTVIGNTSISISSTLLIQQYQYISRKIYQATLTRNDDGLTSRRFKDRLYEHTSDMNNQKNKGTTLSNHVWKLKQQNKGFETKWKILSRGRSFNPSTRQCNLCLKEKYFIMFKPNGTTLNDRSDFFSTCRHRTKPLLHPPD